MSAHENKENTKRSARTTRATHPVWVRMEPRSLTKKKLKRKMIRSPQNNQNLPTIYNLAHALETVKTKRKELLLSASPRGDDRGAGALSGKRSFVAKSFDGVERGRFSGRIVAEADPRGGGKGHGNQNGLDPNRHWPSEKAREGLRGKDAAEDSKDAAEEAQDDCFGQELKLYVGLRGAHGEPDADLARSFGHADQHDVHHANAADQERHGSDTGQHQSERVTGFFLCLEGILGTANVEVLHFAGENVMAFAQKQRDAIPGRANCFGRDGCAHDVVEPVNPFHFFLRRAVGNEDEVVLIVACCGVAFRGENANHSEREVADADRFSEGILIGEQVTNNGLAQQRDVCRRIDLVLRKDPA